ncbi:MAG: xanthine dehydrogenase family protein subunit M [Calditrichaeota bacterium]|nr:MAG: xanthine dehydrogenase family protein subunit M [Calditrichota bacterium]
MKPAPFKYFAPENLKEVVNLLAEYGDDAKVLAGGQSLVPAMNFRLAQPSVLIDLNRVKELFYIKNEPDGHLRIGAMTRQRTVEKSSIIAEKCPLLHATMPFIAHPQIRNRGTIGGSLAHADPAAELPAVTVALDAEFCVQNQKSSRWIPAKDFFVTLFTTAMEPEELLTEIKIPRLPENTKFAFKEVARRHGDYALVGVTTLVTFDENKNCKKVRIVLLSVGEKPVEAFRAEQILSGQKLTREIIEEAAEIASQEDIEPHSDIHASTEFRRHLAKVLTRRALLDIIQ